jgi:hypothetical protein
MQGVILVVDLIIHTNIQKMGREKEALIV